MFPFEPNEYLDHYPQFLVSDFPNTSASSSSSSSPGFLNSAEFHHVEMHPPQYLQHEIITHARDVTTHDLEKRVDHEQTLKFTLCKNEDDQNKMKWMSSKMRLMKKMKNNSDNHGNNIKASAMFEDQKQQHQQASSSVITNDHSNIMSNDSSPYENHPPIRVCSDCNTTKTPLWRSGPKGPKSLCNACGIRQRKARRALAAAAENGKWVSAPAPAPETAAQKIKLQNKELKKRCRSPTKASSKNDNAAKKKNGTLEDFLYNLSKSLAFHRVFPQEEKDAAILLMALSCSGVHG